MARGSSPPAAGFHTGPQYGGKGVNKGGKGRGKDAGPRRRGFRGTRQGQAGGGGGKGGRRRGKGGGGGGGGGRGRGRGGGARRDDDGPPRSTTTPPWASPWAPRTPARGAGRPAPLAGRAVAAFVAARDPSEIALDVDDSDDDAGGDPAASPSTGARRRTSAPAPRSGARPDLGT